MSEPARTLHHWAFDPFSRQARIAAAEKGLRLRLKEERVWDGRQDFLALNPAGETPVLVEGSGPGRRVIAGARALVEYWEEIRPNPPLLPGNAVQRAEARRLAHWFDRKFDAEVNAALLYEIVDKRMTRQGPPDPARLDYGRAALAQHLAYVGYLADDRPWLAGPHYSLADVAAFAHLSCLDAVGEIPWSQHPAAQRWWEKMRSRTSTYGVRDDGLTGLAAAA